MKPSVIASSCTLNLRGHVERVPGLPSAGDVVCVLKDHTEPDALRGRVANSKVQFSELAIVVAGVGCSQKGIPVR